MAKKTFIQTWKATLTFKQWWLQWCPDLKQKEAKMAWDQLGHTIPIKCVNDCGPKDSTALGFACDDGLHDLICHWTEEVEAFSKDAEDD